ncbi:glycosyltransferase family 4 protein [Pedobacter panaciterrae]|jgi:Glycosyltransferase|uniref:glycosyltransferase family 4 protein n=1 Tax=Pedobacter panaciterrae TaxID=363849 RepID=UPI00155DA942|nr:glycosyltransferase family 4 protein [Pedobacter panaciterrae]NQX55855.1 glycosyltransferase family 4 protein [Pedobacter panaciterrae]
MVKERKIILISCDSPRSLLDFRGKLIEALIVKHEVIIFTPKIEHQEIKNKLSEMGVRVYENGLNPSNVSIVSDLKYLFELRRLIKATKPDVFFPYTFKPVIYGAFVARFCRVNHITPMLTGLGYNFLNVGSRKTVVQKITRILLKLSLRASKRLQIIFQNKDDYNTLIRANIITNKNIAHVVNGSGVDLSHYEYSPPDLNNISFLMISRLINAKGIKEYYYAAKQIKEKFPDVVFKLIGPYDDNIDAISADLFSRIKTDGTIQYFGLVDDVRPYINQSSVIVLPSYYGEGVPRCLLEGMAMGRAVITCNSVGCRETINPLLRKANGFLVPIKDIQQLASKMEYYIRHTDDVARFGLNGRKYASEKFDVNKVNQTMVNILEGA